MTKFDEYTGECCTDCTMLIANGETPPEMTEAETAEWLADIDKNWGRLQVHASIGDERGFSSSSCGYCGSHLGGDRHDFIVLAPKGTEP